MPETDLAKVLSSLSISCDNIRYGFAVSKEFIDNEQIVGMFKEEEGTTIIANTDFLNSQRLDYSGEFAKLTVDAQTSLELVGLTVHLSSKLKEASIPANIVAAVNHDHIFVPYKYKDAAIKALKGDNEQDNRLH